MSQIRTPKFGGLRELIMIEAHKKGYFIHLRSDKMYLDLKKAILVAKNESRDFHLCGKVLNLC